MNEDTLKALHNQLNGLTTKIEKTDNNIRELLVGLATAKSPAEEKAWLRFSKHPLVILLAATLLGSVLIPYVNARTERQRRLADERSERATSIVKTAGDVDRKLNLVLTELDGFYKDEVSKKTATLQSQEALKARVHAAYRDFDQSAWSWHWQTLQEAKILHLLNDNEITALDHAVRCYHTALVDGKTALDPMWNEFMGNSITTDSQNIANMVKDSDAHFKSASDRRMQCAEKMVEVFSAQ